MKNSFCVVCRGDKYIISDNDLYDFGYGGIGVGVWYGNTQNYPCKGVVENNQLVFSEEYCNNIYNTGIMDGGAIYVWTKNDKTIIRNNFINRYTGIGDNRGIFCDDGAYNLQIYGNLIMGITSSYCIDSRRVSTVETTKTPGSGIEHANVNIVIKDNIVDGSINFVGNEMANNGCIKGVNYCFYNIQNPNNLNNYRNVTSEGDDVWMGYKIEGGKIQCLEQNDYSRLLKKKVRKLSKGTIELFNL